MDNALEAIALLCEPVEPPKTELEHIHYFYGNTEIPDDLKTHETQRVAFYKATVALVRAYANIDGELDKAGYSDADIQRIKQKLDEYLKLREIIRNATGEKLDMKAYEAAMRHLIDTYIEADAINAQLGGLKGSKDAVAETIENNVRSKIIREHLNTPAFYDKMSALLDEIIATRKAKAIEYEEYLKQIAELVRTVEVGQTDNTPEQLNMPGRRALYDKLCEPFAAYGNVGKGDALELTVRIDETIRQIRPDDWRGVQAKEQIIKAALYGVLQDAAKIEGIFPIITQHKEY